MTRTIGLDGQWTLYYFPQGDHQISDPEHLKTLSLQSVAGKVPGNVELDLVEAGLLPDPYVGENIYELRQYETYEWWYERELQVDEPIGSRRVELVFHGVDCMATYWLDNERIGQSDNMLIEHRFDVSGRIKQGQKHKLTVRIQSAVIEAMSKRYDPSSRAMQTNYEQLWIRKAPHMYGWDIMPRAVSAGIWRSVEIAVHEANEICDLFFSTMEANTRQAVVQLFYQLHAEPRRLQNLQLKLTAVCGSSRFEQTYPLHFTYGHLRFAIPHPVLWWPRGYGDAAMYEITTELLSGDEVLDARVDSIGIRTVELIRTDISTIEHPGQFMFKVNGVPILIKGSNWVPLDMFHSKDAGRVAEAIALAVDLNCNMLRCWGGSVYEDHDFFELCDRNGILVWQDFAMACAMYPQDPAFQETLRKEAESVVRKLRNHPSLAIWCGDNECDDSYVYMGLDPNDNVLTRKVLPRVLFQHDPYRPYVPSSPYISPEAYRLKNEDAYPERHLWGARDYFKSGFYSMAKSHFAGEMGYHGCTNLSSILRYIDEDHVWPWKDNEQWVTHATAPVRGPDSAYRYRVQLMADQINELFGEYPERIEDFIIASQISQAEAKKYFIERVRMRKWHTTGVLWWNLIDGWPQFSDAIVDYYYSKKLAYHYIKRSQQPVCIMVDEPDSWHVRVKIGNDSNQAAKGTFRVWDADSNETLLQGPFAIEANGIGELGAIRAPRSQQRLILIRWEIDGTEYGNHYLQGTPGFSYEQYKAWLEKIAQLPLSFQADQVGV
ncbi:glycoside hydrolase family 2 protein [Paenibacillus spongiae]|uniref:beta-mannosidase n=1 Tax=Paenibacillus spongiae TaxID=2909671 RepID=A0ABY5S1J3_9BACL|nr:sugar-binding domain-containing protein [Paenibacillus spongiae]UVI27736.1 hypothetical protein L1F29_19960 [Paenibacillus spongiae]